MSLAKTIREQRETVLIQRHEGSVHLYEDCSYLSDPVEKDLDVLPDWKIDICNVCKQQFRLHQYD